MSYRSTRANRAVTALAVVGAIAGGVGIERGLEVRSDMSHDCSRGQVLNNTDKAQECQDRSDSADGLIGGGSALLAASILIMGLANGALDYREPSRENPGPVVRHPL